MTAVKVKVRDGWAVFDGKAQRGPGAVVSVPADLAERWQAAGWVDPVADPPAKTAKPARKG